MDATQAMGQQTGPPLGRPGGRLLVVDAEVDGRPRQRVRTVGDVVVDVGPDLRGRPGEKVIDARGGAVIAGLHDHHVHLRALAAASSSVAVGPDVLGPRAGPGRLGDRLRRAPTGADGWVRAVGYHESVAGPLDADRLEALMPGRPVRVQHRSGKLWILNQAGLRAAGVSAWAATGLERDGAGRPTGRLWRLDRALGEAIGAVPVDLRSVGAAAARWGVTGFTDADPSRPPGTVAALCDALPQRLHLMGPPSLVAGTGSPWTLGAVKVVLDDERLPGLDDLVGIVDDAHARGRPVAVHCVSAAQVVLAVAAVDSARSRGGDRIEHGSVIPPELIGTLARLSLTVVTQPGFVADRGDSYLEETDAVDLPDLYRCASLRRAGVTVAFGTDAPHGPADPWVAVAAAIDRRTRLGARLGEGEVVDARAALAMFQGEAAAPGRVRRVEPGALADLCVLAAPLAEVLHRPVSTAVAATVVRSAVVYQDGTLGG